MNFDDMYIKAIEESKNLITISIPLYKENVEEFLIRQYEFKENRYTVNTFSGTKEDILELLEDAEEENGRFEYWVDRAVLPYLFERIYDCKVYKRLVSSIYEYGTGLYNEHDDGE